jgi:hypothetical protein
MQTRRAALIVNGAKSLFTVTRGVGPAGFFITIKARDQPDPSK